MSRASAAVTDHLIGPLLRSVSRSFYLSIRVLPSGLRQPVGLAYLLARATDTLADTSEVAPEVRKPKLKTLAGAIQADVARSEIGDVLSFARLQTDPAERELIESLPQCLEALQRMPGEDRNDIQVVLSKLTRAQMLDLERFGSPGKTSALTTAAELNEYTYLIAGCVGEFWTHMCARHITNFTADSVDRLLELGRQYGSGLQLINILRDAGTDLGAGRCYFPNEDLSAAGLTPSQILDQPGKLMPVFHKWLDRAEQGLRAGMEYSLAVRNRRVRGATALPALIGARTVALLRQAGDSVLQKKVKMPRSEVQTLLRRVTISLASKSALERLFEDGLRSGR